MKKLNGFVYFMMGTTSLVFSGSASPAPEKPNVLFFYIDDLGWKDLSCYGSEFYETPAIDSLAQEGVRFTSAYQAAARCVPSRTSLFTGKYHERQEISDIKGVVPEEYTFAEAFRDGGYRTFFTGKWHLGNDSTRYPDKQGFDINLAGCEWGSPSGDKAGGGKYFSPYGCPTLEDGPEGEYLTDRLTSETIRFIKNHEATEPGQPFLACVFHYAVHTPIEAPDRYVDPYRKKLEAMEYSLPQQEIDGPAKVKLRQNNPVYAGMIAAVDESVRQIRKTLKELGIDDNTIIIFSSDHGGLSSTLKSNGREISTSNYPLRTGKGWLYEGGIRAPLIVYWPGVTKPGTVTGEPVINTDFYPTMLEMAGLPPHPEQHLDGESFADLLRGENWSRKDPIMWYFPKAKTGTGNPNMAALRIDNYKLIHFMYQGRFELYDLDKDLSETHDLFLEKPNIASNCKAELFKIEAQTEMPKLPAGRIRIEKDKILPEYPIGIDSSEYPSLQFRDYEIESADNTLTFHLGIEEKNDMVHPVDLHFYIRPEGMTEWTELKEVKGNLYRLLPGFYSCSWDYSVYKDQRADIKIVPVIHNALYPVTLDEHIIKGIRFYQNLSLDTRTIKSTIYPNPAKEQVFFRSWNEIDQLMICDISGKSIKTYNCKNKKAFSIPVSDLLNGVYLLSVNYLDKNLNQYHKLVIRR